MQKMKRKPTRLLHDTQGVLKVDTFADNAIYSIGAKRTILIIGLDPQLRFMPPHLREWAVRKYGKTFEAVGQLFLRFNKAIIDAAGEYAFAVKPQIAFYEAYGHWGLWAFEETIKYARKRGLLVITDAKRGDGGDTVVMYADGHLGKVDFFGEGEEISKTVSPIRVDCLTVQPGIGSACINPFTNVVRQNGTGIFIVTKSSFKPNSEVEQMDTVHGTKVWVETAALVHKWGEGTRGRRGYRNAGVVMGATYPKDALVMREILPDSWFLIPGYGGQGGTADDAVVGINEDGYGGGVNSSRAILFAYLRVKRPRQYAFVASKAAKASRDELNLALQRAGKWNFN